MSNQILTILVCGILPLILVAISAILGSLYRGKLANRIMVGMREGRFKDLSSQHGARKLRGFSLLALISITGILTIIFLVWTEILPYNSKWTIVLLIFFLFISIISGMLLFKQVLDRLKP
jgi:hypothetical protein